MLKDKPVLIVEGNVYLAMDLCDEVAQLEGRPVGPVDTVVEALAIVDSQHIAAAVLDYDLPDDGVWKLAQALHRKLIPFVIKSSVPVDLQTDEFCAAPVVIKPIQARDVASILALEVTKATQTTSN
jgi:AmiR/NasT family two-component response regulator